MDHQYLQQRPDLEGRVRMRPGGAHYVGFERQASTVVRKLPPLLVARLVALPHFPAHLQHGSDSGPEGPG